MVSDRPIGAPPCPYTIVLRNDDGSMRYHPCTREDGHAGYHHPAKMAYASGNIAPPAVDPKDALLRQAAGILADLDALRDRVTVWLNAFAGVEAKGNRK